MQKLTTCCLLIISLFFFAQMATAETVEEFIASGDAANKAFDHQSALKFFQKAHQLDPANCEALWKMSRAHVDIGEKADKDLQRQHYYMAEKIARQAVAQCETVADAHLALSIAVGRVALMEGGKKKVELSKEVKTEAEKTLELDASNDLAYHVLGRWHREVATLSGILKAFAKILYGGLPDASLEKAVQYFSKAIEIKPDYINHHLELGITYEDMKEWEQAKQEYEKVAELPGTESDDQDHKATAAERMKDVLKKLK
ncbi:hypothetical protein A2V82_03730 [candidate division KSB1 bacterium RBG_16_48_16]|nr:MAG: hypothetical protein A2V82_03730 [candidate division KSB1 bacterium RBG_16_48_16]